MKVDMKKLLILVVLAFVAVSTTACAELMNELGYGTSGDQVATSVGGQVEATSHSVAEKVTERVTAATVEATTTEATTAVVTTTAATEVTTEATEAVTECDHDVVECSRDVTCTEDGYKERIICRICGDVLNEGEVIGAYGHTLKRATYNTKYDEIVWWCECCDFSKAEDVPELRLTVQTKDHDIRLYVTGGYYPSVVMYVVHRGETTLRYVELEESWSAMSECNRRILSFDAELIETVIVYAYDATPYREDAMKFDVSVIDGRLTLTVNQNGLDQYLGYISK